MEITWKVISGKGKEENGRKGTGNGEAKELICMTRGHEQRGRGMPEGMGVLHEGEKGGEKMGQL